MKRLVIVHSDDGLEICRLVRQGHCPVECSIDGNSLVDGLRMDHHGENSALEGVALRAYRDHYGARRDDPRFVVTGAADADATFAIAALAGLVPHPDALAGSLAPEQADRFRRPVLALADLINRVDVDPIGVDLASEPEGGRLLLWNLLTNGERCATQFHAGVFLWSRLLAHDRRLEPLAAAARATEAQRRDLARNADQSVQGLARVVDSSPAWGFDVWYGRRPGRPPEDPASWETPIVVARTADGAITVGCPNRAVAEALFGPHGLERTYPLLGPGWGGRHAVGGSPRGKFMTRADADKAALVLLRAAAETRRGR